MLTRLSRMLESDPETPVRQHSFCAWSDLLGFGSPLISAQWEPSADIVEQLLQRLDAAYRYHCDSLMPLGEFALVLNDGVVRTYYPGSVQNNAVATMPLWLRTVIRSHMYIKLHEHQQSLPGPRTIIAAGLQIKHVFTEVRFDDFVFDYTRQPTKSGLSRSAEMVGNPVVISNPGPLQLNLAFSKAYILDSLGSKGGISGSNLFIDQSVIDLLTELAVGRVPPYEVVHSDTPEGHLFAVLTGHDAYPYLFGLLLAPEPIAVEYNGWKTNVYRLKAFYPHDESPDEFRFDLDNPNIAYRAPSWRVQPVTQPAGDAQAAAVTDPPATGPQEGGHEVQGSAEAQP